MRLPECTRVDADDLESAGGLISKGWRPIEVLETWAGRPPKGRGLLSVAREEDIPALRRTASHFKYDRFHLDPEFPDYEADAIKMDWIEEAVKDPERFVFVRGGAFVSMRIENRKATIDLIGVPPSRQKTGLARGLISLACGVFKVETLEASTQEVNEPAKALYRSLGLKVTRRQRTFHR